MSEPETRTIPTERYNELCAAEAALAEVQRMCGESGAAARTLTERWLETLWEEHDMRPYI